MDRINEHGIEPGAYSGPSGIVVVTAVISKVEKDGVVSLLQEPVVVYRNIESNTGSLTMTDKGYFLLHYKLI
jgi:hypothetical protein